MPHDRRKLDARYARSALDKEIGCTTLEDWARPALLTGRGQGLVNPYFLTHTTVFRSPPPLPRGREKSHQVSRPPCFSPFGLFLFGGGTTFTPSTQEELDSESERVRVRAFEFLREEQGGSNGAPGAPSWGSFQLQVPYIC
jgi:hypothetical protein